MLQENEALLQNHSKHSRVNCFQIDLFSLSGENSCIFLFYITAHIIENKISHCQFFFPVSCSLVHMQVEHEDMLFLDKERG